MFADDNLEFEFAGKDRRDARLPSPHLSDKLINFADFGKKTRLIFTGFTSPDGASRTVETFVNEFLSFPNGRFDDQVDSLVQLLHWQRVHAVAAADVDW